MKSPESRRGPSHIKPLLVLPVLAILTACSALAGATPKPSDSVAALAMRIVAPIFAGLPSRAVAVIAPARAGTPISVIDSQGRTLDTAATNDAGRAFLSWTWPETGVHRLHAWAADGTAVGLASVDIEVESRAATTDSTADEHTRTDDNARLVEAAGQTQWIDCRGSGGPTMVMIAGLDGSSRDWDPMIGSLRRQGRTCTYDRPGLGQSPGRAGELQVDAGSHATELHELLTAAGEEGPFLVVGHSYGGLIARSLQNLFPESVAGMVLLDPVPAGFDHLYPGYGSSFVEASPQTTIDLDRSSEASGGAAALVGTPLIVLAAGKPRSWTGKEEWRLWHQAQADTAAASSNSLHLVAAGATHQLQSTATELATDSVLALRASLRQHRILQVTAALAASEREAAGPGSDE